MNRSTRILLLLVIDVVFFFVELIVGYAVGSLALVADSFHMLNDVLSLVVALYAIKLTNQSQTDSRYSYGWHRAEILAALVNGVFLLALCFSIFLEACERFFSTPEISQPRLIVVVGSLGLASNIVGLFLFHDHGHSHVHAPSKGSESSSSSTSIRSIESAGGVQTPRARSPQPHKQSTSHKRKSRSRSQSYSSLYGHPVATRASLVQAAQDLADASTSDSPRSPVLGKGRSRSRIPSAVHEDDAQEGETTPVDSRSDTTRNGRTHETDADEQTPLIRSGSRASIKSQDTQDTHGAVQGDHHGHVHGSMNMHALLLHVFGDALGNIGVIATGLVIWLTTWSYKYYFDPIISLVITAIIFSSALPLVRSTSFILLQGVPPTISLDEVRNAILAVDGVLSLHELHVWQLSENKIVASVHVMASRNHDFMPVAAKIRKALHHRGIHSSTIQPEYRSSTIPDDRLKSSADTNCLILCPPDSTCVAENACCPPPPIGDV
ncbi:cation efflux protein [Irpex rosettiformis]|uniref:Cation efflux protein n=1 Tax=Irpex rosettiformis TaxID=378272 RepID=A0ACB8UK90_9APHY|nr:cation efflux protein [Irpex rosettiformis]